MSFVQLLVICGAALPGLTGFAAVAPAPAVDLKDADSAGEGQLGREGMDHIPDRVIVRGGQPGDRQQCRQRIVRRVPGRC
jgi:hypothetical protein